MCPDPILGYFHMYGIMIAIGILAAFAVLQLYGKKLGVSERFLDFVFYNTLAAIVLGFGSAALFQATYNFIENPSRGFKYGGITFIGGLIGGTLCFLAGYFIFKKLHRGKLTDMISVIPCAITVAHAFGRVGCFFAGCCHGKPWDGFCAVKFPHLSYTVHPTQLYEAFFLFLIFGVMSFLVLKYKFRYNMPLYLATYGVFRFILEYFRGDDRGEFILGITPSQFWSIVMVLLSVGTFFLLRELFRRDALNSGSAADDGNSKE